MDLSNYSLNVKVLIRCTFYSFTVAELMTNLTRLRPPETRMKAGLVDDCWRTGHAFDFENGVTSFRQIHRVLRKMFEEVQHVAPACS